MDVRGTLGGNSPGAHSQLEAEAGFLGKWAENVMSSQTGHFHGNQILTEAINCLALQQFHWEEQVRDKTMHRWLRKQKQNIVLTLS